MAESGIPIRFATEDTDSTKRPSDVNNTEQGQPLLNSAANELYVMTSSSDWITIPDSSDTVQNLTEVLVEGNDTGGTNINFGDDSDASNIVNLDATNASIDNLSADVNAAISTTSEVQMNTNKITGLADGTADQDVVNKRQLDAVAEGASYKDPVVAASDGTEVDISGGSFGGSLDDITINDGDRVLLKDQDSAPAENGIYVYDSGSNTFSRAADMDEDSEVSGGQMVYVEQGTTNAEDRFAITSDDAVLGTDPITFGQTSSLAEITAGQALQKTGDTLDLIANAPLSTTDSALSLDYTSDLETNASDELRISSALMGDGVTGASGSVIDVLVTDLTGLFISADGSNNFTVDIGSNLENDGSDNIQVNSAALAGSYLSETSNTLDVNLGDGLLGDGSDNVAVDVDALAGSGIDVTGTAAGNDFQLTAADESMSINASDFALNLDTTTGAVTSSPNSANPLTTTADGVNIAHDNDSIVLDGNNALAVGTVDGGTW